MNRPLVKHIALAAGAFLLMVFMSVLVYASSDLFRIEYTAGTSATSTESTAALSAAEAEAAKKPDNRTVVEHQPLPPQAKIIYMTSCVAGTPSFRQQLVELMQETEINSVIIDIKDYSGTISFAPESDAWQPAWQDARCGARDMRELIQMLHDNDIFVIGRITVFQDPFHAAKWQHLAVKRADGQTVWRDHKGLSFIDVAAKEYWDHIVALSVDSYNLGFDELNFDYVRYPSDGNMQDISFPHTIGSEWPNDKQANLEAFFAYLAEQLDDEEMFAAYRHEGHGRASSTPWTSADLFGMTTTNYDDLSIGQVQDRAAPYFDFIAPMVYPSHYPDGSFGYGDPNDYPYQIVHYAMKSGVERMANPVTPMQGFLHEPQYVENASGTPVATGKYLKPTYGPEKLRTWIQDFDYGGDYDAADVRAQIQASYDAGVMSFMIWAPSNIYTRGALKAPGVLEVSEGLSPVASSTQR